MTDPEDDRRAFALYTLLVCVFALAACVLGAWVMMQTNDRQLDSQKETR